MRRNNLKNPMSEMRADNPIVVRLYRPEDRLQVREIACATAGGEKSIETFFHDREAIADVLMRYYTDYEPGSLWVASSGPLVAGYLTGCLDTKKYLRILIRKILPQTMGGTVVRGALWRLETWRLLAGLVGTGLAGGRPKVDLDARPAHLHINLRQGFRGRGIGTQLMDSFKRQVEQAGGAGIHLLAAGDNEPGHWFFEAQGFRRLGEWPIFLPEGRWFRRASTVAYGWTRGD
jgi:ribosomal protein S18 acetylase RimI-like enzyme